MADEDSETDELTKRFALAIKDARERNGMSQQALAFQIGVSLDHVSKLERSKYLPGLDVAARLVRALGVDANKLLGAQPATRTASRYRLEAEAELLRLAESLDEKTLRTAIELVEVLARRGKQHSTR